MSERSIKIPGPNHPITVEPQGGRVVVTLGGKTIADTTDALTLREARYPAVQYIPRVAAIKNFLAFYPDRVDAIDVTEG